MRRGGTRGVAETLTYPSTPPSSIPSAATRARSRMEESRCHFRSREGRHIARFAFAARICSHGSCASPGTSRRSGRRLVGEMRPPTLWSSFLAAGLCKPLGVDLLQPRGLLSRTVTRSGLSCARFEPSSAGEAASLLQGAAVSLQQSSTAALAPGRMLSAEWYIPSLIYDAAARCLPHAGARLSRRMWGRPSCLLDGGRCATDRTGMGSSMSRSDERDRLTCTSGEWQGRNAHSERRRARSPASPLSCSYARSFCAHDRTGRATSRYEAFEWGSEARSRRGRRTRCETRRGRRRSIELSSLSGA